MEEHHEDSIQNAFSENQRQDWSAEREMLMTRKINELGLRLEGTRLEALVQRLYTEFENAGIQLRPRVYLADEWGCPEGIPLIGIPFYLADEKLARIEDEM